MPNAGWYSLPDGVKSVPGEPGVSDAYSSIHKTLPVVGFVCPFRLIQPEYAGPMKALDLRPSGICRPVSASLVAVLLSPRPLCVRCLGARTSNPDSCNGPLSSPHRAVCAGPIKVIIYSTHKAALIRKHIMLQFWNSFWISIQHTFRTSQLVLCPILVWAAPIASALGIFLQGNCPVDVPTARKRVEKG